jgi:hypothetical protein
VAERRPIGARGVLPAVLMSLPSRISTEPAATRAGFNSSAESLHLLMRVAHGMRLLAALLPQVLDGFPGVTRSAVDTAAQRD